MTRKGKDRPRIAVIVLAAGLSSRVAPNNKMLTVDGANRTMVSRVVDAALGSMAAPTHVVVGHQADRITAALAGRPIKVVHALDYEEGLAASLRAGISALPSDTVAAMICLGDMPLVTSAIIDQVVAAYDADHGRLIIVPTHGGKRGNPVLWDRRFFPDMLALSGDAGARQLLRRHANAVTEIELDTDAVLTDFDTAEALSQLATASESSEGKAGWDVPSPPDPPSFI